MNIALRCVVRSLLLLVCSAVVGWAQGNSGNSDNAWAALTKLSANGAPELTFTESGLSRDPGRKKTGVEVKQNQADRAAAYKQAAKAAKDFYTAYPENAKAAEAKKLEVVNELLGVTDDDKDQEQAALKLAKQYRSGKDNPASDRFEVAVLAERVQVRAKTGGVFKNDSAELEKIADKLQAEFGDLPEAYRFYASVARTADRSIAARIAQKLLKSSSTPANIRAEAQMILDREDLIGKPLHISLSTIDGKVVDLSKRSGKFTILYIWSSLSDGHALPGLAAAAKTLPPGAEVVYLCVSGSGDKLKQLEAEAPIPGIYCFELTSTANPVAATLKIGHVPFVYLLDRTSKVVGFGPADRLPGLIAASQ